MKRKYLVFLIILIGILFRFGEYIPNRSLWFDEAAVANKLSETSLLTLVDGRSRSNLAYPFGFLLAEKIAMFVAGNNSELVVRFPSFLAGILSIFLFYFLSKKILSYWSSLFATFLFAINPMLIYYSSEVKPYSFDVLFSILICWIFFKINEASTSFKQKLMCFLLVFISVWFSYGVVFILFGSGSILTLYYLFKGMRKEALSIGGLLVVGGISFIFNYFFIIRHFTFNLGLQNYWEFVYPPAMFFGGYFIWARGIFYYFCSMLLNYSFGWALIFCFFGGVGLYRKNKKFLAMFLGLFFSVFAASLFHRYPFFGRLVLFLVPVFLIVIAAGLEAMSFSNKKINIVMSVSLGLFIAYFPMKVALKQLSEPFVQQEIKSVLKFVSEKRQQGQMIYVFRNARKSFQYYAPRFDFSDEDYIYGQVGGVDEEFYEMDLKKARSYEYVWIIYTHIMPEEARALDRAIKKCNGVVLDYFLVEASKGLPPGYMKNDAISAGAVLYYFKNNNE